MAIRVYQQAFNVGQYDADKLHRVDLERVRLAAERQVNLLCDSVGAAWPRPGTEFLAGVRNNAANRLIGFSAGTDDGFILELTSGALRVIDSDTDTLVTRTAVNSVVGTGDFSSDTNWTKATSAGQTTAIASGLLQLSARASGGRASAKQAVTTTSIGVEHALRIVVARGPVTFRLGSTDGGAEYLPGGVETELRTGVHSIAFTPTASPYYIEFSTESKALRYVDSCQVEAAGVMEIATPWPTAALPLIRHDQSLDVMFCACDGYQPKRIERRGDHSWSVVDYQFSDGPFFPGRSAEVQLTPAATEGNTTLTADRNFFNANHVGALFRLFHEGQKLDTYLAGANQWTEPFLVTGINETNFEERKFTWTVSGAWVGTLRFQRSTNGPDGDYKDYRSEQSVATVDITANAAGKINDDNDDNIDVWVRIGFPEGKYTSGEARVQISYGNAGGFGIARVTAYTSPTVVSVEVLTPFKGTHGTKRWREGWFSPIQGWPTAVSFSDGRLWWLGLDKVAGSISDAFDSFDEEFDGDAGPIARSIAVGGRNKARWAMPLSSMMIGCDGRVVNARASALDDILTPDNTGMKSAGKIGAAAISPVELADDRGVFVQSAGNTLYEITWSNEKGRYVVNPFSKLTANMFTSGITDLDVQTLPDQRMWVTTREADAVCIVFEPSQQVLAAHIPISTSRTGEYFESFAIVPGANQDRVYASVKRIINGATVRYIEKFALDSETAIGPICKVMDSHVTFGAGNAVIGGLSHLEGAAVVVWMDGAPVTDPAIIDPALDNAMIFTVAGGQITLPSVPVTGGCVGLAYDWQYKSSRLALGVEGATPMLTNKSLEAVGLLLADYVRSGVKYGAVTGSGAFDAPYSLPLTSSATGTDADEIVAGPGKDETPLDAGGVISFDERVCIAGRSPKPFKLLGMVLGVQARG